MVTKPTVLLGFEYECSLPESCARSDLVSRCELLPASVIPAGLIGGRHREEGVQALLSGAKIDLAVFSLTVPCPNMLLLLGIAQGRSIPYATMHSREEADAVREYTPELNYALRPGVNLDNAQFGQMRDFSRPNPLYCCDIVYSSQDERLSLLEDFLRQEFRA